MKLTRHDNKNYIVDEKSEHEVDRLVYGMLKNNSIKCLLPLSFRFVDDVVISEYDITGLQPLSRVYERRKMNTEDIVSIIRQLAVAGEEMVEYLLRGENLCLEPDYIFSDIEGKRLVFCAALGPVAEGGNPYRSLLAFIMDKVDYDIKEAVGLAYSLVRAAEGENPLEAMQSLLTADTDANYKTENLIAEEEYETEALPEFVPKKRKRFAWGQKRNKKKQIMALALQEPEPAALMLKSERFITQPLVNQIVEKHYYLQPIENENKGRVEIDHFPYTIGKLDDGVDYRPDSPMVSRLHARFELGEGGIVLEDLNSSNGTYVNSNSIFGQGKVSIKDGDMIRFANMGYRLEIYGNQL